ncbi:MAG: Lrp/AsnC family transcriptional regulator [Candidatus Kapaibacterium sp.]|nr:MAG: Lrp/AsnC family transcriptional regulator [Candidatus Kapabacteria bacterium]
MAVPILNDVDRKICDILQRNGRAHFNELAEVVHLSVPAVSERVRKLEEKGIIRGYTAKLHPEAFGLNIAAFIWVTVEGSHNYKKFLDNCTNEPEIMDCHAITGDSSHLVKVRTTSPASLERLLSRIQEWSGVKKTLTNIILSTHYESLTIDTGATIPAGGDVPQKEIPKEVHKNGNGKKAAA